MRLILQVATSHRLREKERRTNPRNEELDQAKSNNSSYFKNLLYSCVFSSVSSQRVNPPSSIKRSIDSLNFPVPCAIRGLYYSSIKEECFK